MGAYDLLYSVKSAAQGEVEITTSLLMVSVLSYIVDSDAREEAKE